GFTIKEIKEFLGNEKNNEKDMEMIKNVLNRVQEEIKKLKSIEKELLTDLNKKPRKIGIPFLEEVEEKRGVRILKEVNITKEENLLSMIKNVIKHEEKGYKILSHTIRKKIEDLPNENSLENGYITTDNPELHNSIILKKGKYASILGKGSFENSTVLTELFNWIKENNLKIIDEYANIFFNPEGIGVKSKKDVPYEIKILVE
ncbi:MerR family transcriptional regulator, partial [Fusobacterium ulcerans]|uniref:MerR family transcriptional regulator n=1 Tax=Fusobacterium ulcerans TaxID=861 RepID=UPI003FEE8861